MKVAAGLLNEPAVTPLLAGHNIGPYQVLSLAGRGGMGEVYEARDVRLGRKVALKLLPSEFTKDADRLRRFEQEARSASSLNHPNIITIHEIGEADSVRYIVTEFVEGETLRARMAGGRPAPVEALDVAIQVASALASAHSAGIVHRDVKPENVMIRPDGLVKVLDFGLAKLTEPTRNASGVTVSTLKEEWTEPGRVIGTPHYMSPEQARGVAIAAGSDIFGLGVMLYEMIAGERPFTGKTPADVIASILEREPAPLSKYCSDLPDGLEHLTRKALAKEVEDRYQSAGDMLLDLKEVRQRLESPRMQTAGLTIRRRKELFAWASIAAALVIVLAVGWLWMNRVRVAAPVESKVPAIAILPFRNLSTEPESEQFVDGLTTEIINNLSQVEGLEVRSQTSSFAFKDKPQVLGDISSQLNVDYVVEGEVRRDGNALRINTRFVRAADEKTVWTGKFDRELKDIFVVQDEISRGIVNKLRLNLGRGRRRYETSVDAYELYTRLRGEDDNLGQHRKIIGFEQVISLDPSFAPAYAGLAIALANRSRVFLGNPAPPDQLAKIRTMALKAVEWIPSLRKLTSPWQ